jgi:cytochrome c-type biogenesis protein CcmH
MKVRAILLCILMVLSTPIFAVGPDEILPDAALEARARQLSAGLRCLVCQNQSIDDSDADLAKDLRLLVRERLVAGDSNDEVEQYIVDRYGEYVLLNPRLNAHTLLLWIAAPGLLIVGLGALWLAGRKKRAPAPVGLTKEEQAALDQLRADTDRQ